MALLRTLFGRRRRHGARSAPPVTTLAAPGGTRSHVQRHDLFFKLTWGQASPAWDPPAARAAVPPRAHSRTVKWPAGQ
jgi:hypothetical protein